MTGACRPSCAAWASSATCGRPSRPTHRRWPPGRSAESVPGLWRSSFRSRRNVGSRQSPRRRGAGSPCCERRRDPRPLPDGQRRVDAPPVEGGDAASRCGDGLRRSERGRSPGSDRRWAAAQAAVRAAASGDRGASRVARARRQARAGLEACAVLAQECAAEGSPRHLAGPLRRKEQVARRRTCDAVAASAGHTVRSARGEPKCRLPMP